MKVLHVNAGLETGGGLFHIINLLTAAKEKNQDFALLTFAEGPVARAAREKGLNVDVLNIFGRLNTALPKKLKEYLTTHDFDIVHTHGPRANLIMALIHNKVGAKWLITVHSDPLEDFANRGVVGKIFEKLNLRSLKKADHLLAITERFKQILTTKIGIDSAKVSVIYNGIFFRTEALPKQTHLGFNLINVARMEPVKGQQLLIKAIAELNLPDLHLNLIGDGSLIDELKQQVAANDLKNNVTFNGFLSQGEIAQIYPKMDLAVLTSYSESFPLVLLEAADAGVALLSTDVGDMNKMIPDEQYGFVAKIGNLESIKGQILKAYHLNKVQLQEVASTERKYLSDNFSIFNQLADIIAVYQKVG